MVFAFRLTTTTTATATAKPNANPESYRENQSHNATDDFVDFLGIPLEVTAVLTSQSSIIRSIVYAARVSVIGPTFVFQTFPRFFCFSLHARARFRRRSRPAIVSTVPVWGSAPIRVT
jgi:hypothetical protein